MSLIAKRLLSTFATAFFFAFAVIRTVLDLIGYATLPDDAVVAQSLLHHFFLWVLSVPSWLTFVTAFGAYAWLTYVSWPRTLTAPSETPSVPSKIAAQPANPNVHIAAKLRGTMSYLRRFKRRLIEHDPIESDELDKIAGDFRAVEVSLQKMGYAVPWLSVDADPIGYIDRNLEYITKVEPLISAGHEKEARRRAALIVEKFSGAFVDKDRF